MSKKKESLLSKISPLVKLIFVTCVFATINQMFSIVVMVKDFEGSSQTSIDVNVLQMLEEKKEENRQLAQQLKQKDEIIQQHEKQEAQERERQLQQEQELKQAQEQLRQELQAKNMAQEPQQLQQGTKEQEQVAKPRILFGIFTYDDDSQSVFRGRFRSIFDSFIENNDYRVCSLGNYEMAVRKQRNGELANVTSSTASSSSQNQEYHDDYFYKMTFDNCQYIYTFVIGGNMAQDAPRLIAAPVNNTNDLLYPRRPGTLKRHKLKKEYLESKWTDLTLLNIHENMNDGKSQTWFHYASLVGKELDIEYVGKWDSDTLPWMDRFFDWLNEQRRLPPSPYNNNIIVGAPVNKDWWWMWTNPVLPPEQEHKELFFKEHFGNHFHLYAQGQCYLMSIDLAYFVAQESQHVLEEGQYDLIRQQREQEQKRLEREKRAQEKKARMEAEKRRQEEVERADQSTTSGNLTQTLENNQQQQKQPEQQPPPPQQQQPKRRRRQQQIKYDDYIEGHEDHDVASMAFHSPNPIQFQFLTKYQLFWRHGIKNKKGANAAGAWHEEIERTRNWVKLHTNRAHTELPQGDLMVQRKSTAFIV